MPQRRLLTKLGHIYTDRCSLVIVATGRNWQELKMGLPSDGFGGRGRGVTLSDLNGLGTYEL